MSGEEEIDVYERQDEIEASLKAIDKIIEEAENEDPEFYSELNGIFTHKPH